MYDSREPTLRKFEDDTVLEVVANRPDRHAASQRDVDRLPKLTNINLRSSTKENAKPCCSEAQSGSQQAETRQKKQKKA